MKNIRDKSNKNLKDINRLTNTSNTCVNKKIRFIFLLTLKRIMCIIIKKKILKKMKGGAKNDKELINDEKCWGGM